MIQSDKFPFVEVNKMNDRRLNGIDESSKGEMVNEK